MSKIEIKQYPYTNILGWSFSRSNSFNTCKRRYFYDYYNKFSDDNLEILKLKNLTSQALEVGIITHKLISYILGFLKNDSIAFDMKMIEEFIDSEMIMLKSKDFSEVYFNKSAKISFKNIKDLIKNNIKEFLGSSRFNWFVKNRREISNWVIEPEGFGESRISLTKDQKYKTYFKVDYLFEFENQFYIFDWKSGKSNSKHKEQMIGYYLWLESLVMALPTQTNLILSYLFPKYNEVKVDISQTNNFELIDTIKKQIINETNDMYDYLLDIKENIPKDISCFPVNENKNKCNFCNYKNLCGVKNG